MLILDLILRNPLRLIGQENEDILPPGGVGAVLARAGVGKTALLVQIALNTLLKNNNVLHISLDDPVNKVNLWYKEVFRLLAEKYSVKQMDELWDSLLPHRFIMTFKVEGFSVPKLEERLTDIMEQKIFLPRMIIVDGLPFDDAARESLSDLKALAERHSLHVWFTAVTHRSEEPPPNELPAPIAGVSDLFEDIIQLQPKGKEIRVRALKGGEASTDGPGLFLDPSTMLIIDEP